jgi:hypothetical protein
MVSRDVTDPASSQGRHFAGGFSCAQPNHIEAKNPKMAAVAGTSRTASVSMPPPGDGRRIRTSKGFPRTWVLLASRSGREKTIGGLGGIPTVRLPGSRSIPAPANENARLRGIGE